MDPSVEDGSISRRRIMSGTLCHWNFKLIYNINPTVSRQKDLKCTVSNGCLAFRSPANKDFCLKLKSTLLSALLQA
jgi:hypothetical protein